MAYMNQEKKSKIAVELKKVMPKDWKWSLSVDNHSTIVLTISAGPAELLQPPTNQVDMHRNNGAVDMHRNINTYHIEKSFASPELNTLFVKINDALNLDNFDIMTNYFHVGHYVDIHIGKWDKPFKAIN